MHPHTYKSKFEQRNRPIRKLKVRDVVTEYLTSKLDGCTSKNEARNFPDRKYDGYDFPEGNYDALIIYLGEGVGDNWWCVAFPPLCFVPESEGGEKIVYKSWVKEWLDKLFSNK